MPASPSSARSVTYLRIRSLACSSAPGPRRPGPRITKVLTARDTRAVDGILTVDKPVGWTSHDIVAVCRRVAGRARTGHGGTLDPQASGVLPILFGTATKFVER
ncbi:MAG: hypothetical protein H0V71_09555, partial [Chloroflexi bacterium]|nr:hypothetical protein [Chloroflexota bacterium]